MFYQTPPGRYFPLYKVVKRSTFAVLLFGMVITGYACQNKKTNPSMNEQDLNPQQSDSGRLLSVANVEQTDSNRKVIAWFFETPQIFEFNLEGEEAQNMFRLLKKAKEMQSPVNVYSTAVKGINRITRITPPTEAQLSDYKKNKALREQPAAVPPPKKDGG